MADNQEFKYPGDISLLRVSLHRDENSEGIDIRSFMYEMSLYEDIFAPSMSGTISLTDSIGFSSAFPIIGGERIRVEFITPTLDASHTIRKTFVVYKMENKVMVKSKTIYTLHFISEYAYLDSRVKISRPIKGQAPIQIMEILKNDLKVNLDEIPFSYDDENNLNDISILPPYWSPLKTISYLSSICVESESKASNSQQAGFLFYEDNKGLNFWSYASLVTIANDTNDNDEEKNVWLEFFYDANQGRTSDGQRDMFREMQTVQSLIVDKQFDMLERLSTGMYNNHVAEFDLLKKKYTPHMYDYFRDFEHFDHMNKDPVMLNAEIPFEKDGVKYIGHMMPYVSFDKAFGDAKDPGLDGAKTNITMGLLSSVTIEIVIHGRTSFTVGDKIHLNVPKTTGSGGSDIDPLLSGAYLVTSIHHRINEFRHEMIMKLVTDSYHSKLAIT